MSEKTVIVTTPASLRAAVEQPDPNREGSKQV